MGQLLLVGEDQFFHSRELHGFSVVHVQTDAEALSLSGRFDFDAIVAANGETVLKEVRSNGKHTPFLNISERASAIDCCGGHMTPSASDSEKAGVLAGLMNRNHDSDCI
ncbi:MAG: hypothetical protein ACJ76H_07270 [Bacteriovoracaceae bacterium]